MPAVLSYYSPDASWSRHHELTWEQVELNAGARRIYAARLLHRADAAPYPRTHPGHAALPAAFAPQLLCLPSPARSGH